MKRACVVGWPIAHSRSPLIHGYWLRQHGIDGSYTREPVQPEDLQSFLQSMRAHGLAGCNVTVPHKETAFAAAVVREPSAIAVGAANTLWFEGEHLACANSDTYGFMANLDASAPSWRNASGPILILGAGGSARAVVYGFLQAGRTDIRVVNRSLERAADVARHFGNGVTALKWEARHAEIEKAAVIVNTTSLGMNGAGSIELDFARARQCPVVADLVYVPLQTELLASARAAGLVTVGGLGMLLHQAVPGFEKWFGIRPRVTQELYDLIAADIGRPAC